MAGSDWKALIPQADALEDRCASEWDASTERRRQYRAMRRVNPHAAHNFMMEPVSRQSMPTASEIDQLFDPICGFFFMANEAEQGEVRIFFRERKRLLGNLRNYLARCARKLQETGDSEFMLRGLSAVVVDGGQSLLDFSSGLRALHGAAEEHGLNPGAYFRYAESLSNSETLQLLSRFVSQDDIGEEVTWNGAVDEEGRFMPNQGRHVTDPSYLSAQMFAKVLQEQFFENTNDPAVRRQAITLITLLRSSGCLPQIIVDVQEATRISGHRSDEMTAEIAFAMGMQFGFELAHTYPSPH